MEYQKHRIRDNGRAEIQYGHEGLVHDVVIYPSPDPLFDRLPGGTPVEVILEIEAAWTPEIRDAYVAEAEKYAHNPTKQEAYDALEAAAGRQRALHVTVSPGKSLEYAEKEREARALRAGDEGPFPFLEAEVGRFGEDAAQVAEFVLARRDDWARLGGAILREQRRLEDLIEIAEDGRAAMAVLAEADWPEA